MQKRTLWISALAVVLIIPLAVLGYGQKWDKDQSDSSDPGQTVYWGVDSASQVDDDFFKCVEEHYGEPAIFGRYLGTIEGVSHGLSQEEITLLHDEDVKIIPIYNHFSDATTKANGEAMAKDAIALAQELDMPEDVVIFADIEPKYPVDDAFIHGWVDTMMSSDYKPGIYGVFTKDSQLTKAYRVASEKNQVRDNTIIWNSSPDSGVTKKDNAPDFEPGAPDDIEVSIWQYGLDGDACNIDTNLVESAVMGDLW